MVVGDDHVGYKGEVSVTKTKPPGSVLTSGWCGMVGLRWDWRYVGGARCIYGGTQGSSGAQGGGGGLSTHKNPSHRGSALVNDMQGGPNIDGEDLQGGVVSDFEVVGVHSGAGRVVGLVVLT